MKNYLILPLLLAGLSSSAQYTIGDLRKVPFMKQSANDNPVEIFAADFNHDGNMDIVLDGDLPINQSGFIVFNSRPIFYFGSILAVCLRHQSAKSESILCWGQRLQ